MMISMLRIPSGITFENAEPLSVLLPKERQEKNRRLKRGRDKVTSLFTGFLIKRMLSEALRLPDADRFIRYGKYGRPELSSPLRGHFSVSHSGEMIGFIFSDVPVGIDVECCGRYNLRIASRFFTETEQKCIENSSNPQNTFCRVWTAKEAFLKMTGSGLSRPLNSFDVISEYKAGRLKTLSVKNHAVSVCSTSVIKNLTVQEYRTEEILPDFSADQNSY